MKHEKRKSKWFKQQYFSISEDGCQNKNLRLKVKYKAQKYQLRKKKNKDQAKYTHGKDSQVNNKKRKGWIFKN